MLKFSVDQLIEKLQTLSADGHGSRVAVVTNQAGGFLKSWMTESLNDFDPGSNRLDVPKSIVKALEQFSTAQLVEVVVEGDAEVMEDDFDGDWYRNIIAQGTYPWDVADRHELLEVIYERYFSESDDVPSGLKLLKHDLNVVEDRRAEAEIESRPGLRLVLPLAEDLNGLPYLDDTTDSEELL